MAILLASKLATHESSLQTSLVSQNQLSELSMYVSSLRHAAKLAAAPNIGPWVATTRAATHLV